MHLLRLVTFLGGLGPLVLCSCVSRKMDVVPLLPPTAEATLSELVAHINQWSAVDSLVLRVDLQFETIEQAEQGQGRRYRTAQGRLLLERPGHIRLNVEAPILSADIAEMASDGTRFQLLIHPPEYRALIEGSNDRSYHERAERLDEDPELEKAGPLVNIRPQHFTEAFLISPIPEGDPHVVAFVNEAFRVEADDRPRAKKNARVKKSYYVLTALRLGEDSPRTRYWFDRVGELVLKRQQVYDARGRLVADIDYSEYLPATGETRTRFASRVRIDRPYDHYALILNVKPDGIMVNRDLPDTAFVLDAPPEWRGTVRRVDLDARENPSR